MTDTERLRRVVSAIDNFDPGPTVEPLHSVLIEIRRIATNG